MNPLRTFILLAGLLLLALPAMAVDTFQVTINSNSPSTVPTGLIIQSGDRLLVQAEGAMRLSSFGPFMEGWFDPSGLGRLERANQIHPDSPFGVLLGSYTGLLSSGFSLGELASSRPSSIYEGNEFMIGVNMSATDLSLIEGAFKVHVTRFSQEEADELTLTVDASSPRPLDTGIVANPGDQFLVIGQGAARVVGNRPVTDGWFDASGLGFLQRSGQIFSKTPYGGLLATFSSSLPSGFSIGDAAAWSTQPADEGDELRLGLNMSDSDQASLQGSIVVHILRISSGALSGVNEGGVPGADAIVSVGNYPNPFNPMTTVRFELTQPKEVRVPIVNLAGELVQTLSNRMYPTGTHQLNWDGRDARGRGQSSGTYFLRLETNEAVKTHKLTLVQ